MEAAGKRFILHGSRSDIFTIWNLSDIHLGSRACAVEQIKEDIQRIKDDPFAFWLGGGDYADYIGFQDKRFDPDAVAENIKVSDLGKMGKVLTEQVRDLLMPIRHKCLGLLYGNHEKQYQKWQEQTHLHSWLCTELEVPNLGYSALFDVSFVRLAKIQKPHIVPELPKRSGCHVHSYRFFVHHGAGFAMTKAGKLKRLMDFMTAFDADITMCVDEKTEILTTKGWQKYGQIKVGDPIYTFNNGKVQKDKILNISITDYNGTMVRFKNQSIDMLLSPNHQVLYKNGQNQKNKNPSWMFRSARDLYSMKAQLRVPTNGYYSGEANNYTDAEIALTGWIIAEGHFHRTEPKGGNGISIIQKNKKHLCRIRELLNILGYRFCERKRKDGCTIFYINAEFGRLIQDRLADEKNIPNWTFRLNTRQFDVLLEALIDGDGSRRLRGNSTYYSKNENLIDRLQMLATMHGYRTKKYYKKGGFKNGCWNLNINPRSLVTVALSQNQATIESYGGIIWCVETKNTTFIARRNGQVFVTGNCGHVHDQEGVRIVTIGADQTCTRLVQRHRLGVISGSYLKTYAAGVTTYGEQRGYAPTTLGAATVEINPDKGTFKGEI